MRDRLEKSWARFRFSLPTPLLRGMAGGAAVVREGRTLDPRLQYLAHISRKASGSAGLTPDEARERDARMTDLLAPPRERGVTLDDAALTGPTGAGLDLRVYEPADQTADNGVILYAHGGGGVIGDLDSGAAFCAMLARLCRAPVVSVDYRLAPEHRFPAGYEDFTAAYDWLVDHGSRFGAAPGRVAVAGASIGGGFAAALCQGLHQAGRPQPMLQLLLYPLLDMADPDLRLAAPFEQAWPLSLAGMTWSRDHYMGPEANASELRLSPARNPDLAGLAPAIIATAGFDPLRRQARDYALALQSAGVQVDYRCYDSLTHDFAAFTGVTPFAEAACREIGVLAAKALHKATVQG